MVSIPEKWQRFGTSIFSEISQSSSKFGAINLAQGFPDFDGPETIKHQAIKAIQNGPNQYAPSTGLPKLRNVISKHQELRTGQQWCPESETTVFSGATEALYCSISSLFSEGDEIIVFEPFYESYQPNIWAIGAKMISIPLKQPDWSLDKERILDKITPRTKGMILNTPHNPTGKVFTEDETNWLASIAVSKDLIVITDEVYEYLTYDHKHISIATLDGMAERTVTISSTAKTFSFTGWKIGYSFAPPLLTNAIRACHQHTVFCSATPLQSGMIPAFELPSKYFEDLRSTYREKKDRLIEILQNCGFNCFAPEGTYFLLADYSQHSEHDDIHFTQELIENAGVATIPISGFYSNRQQAEKELRLVRFGFCKDIQTIEEAGKRLHKWVKGPKT